MTTHGDLYDFNIMKSVEKYIRDSGLGSTYTLVFEDTEFNPSTLSRWIQVSWITFGPTIFTLNTFHVRYFSRSKDDRFGRIREKMVGDTHNVLSSPDCGSGIIFYDFMNNPGNPQPILYSGESGDPQPLRIAIRIADRSAVLDAEEMLENSSPVRGVSVVVSSYNAHVARPNVQW